MTDITELAQRVERIISDMKLKHGGNDIYAPVMKWGEFLALVEALEKAKHRIDEMEARIALAAMDSEPVALQPELAKVIYHFRDWNEGFPVERFKADYVISWMLANYPPAQPAPVVPDELLKEYLRLVQCMLSDYRDGNHGDAQRWIRHIAKASGVFAEKHGLSPWEMAKKTFAHHPAHCVCVNCINARSKWDYV